MYSLCPCGSNKDFSNCCEPFIQEKIYPETAEQLMRSRYSAYATIVPIYLVRTTHPSQQKHHAESDIRAWAKENRWQKLEIVSCQNGQEEDSSGTVEFKAYYINSAGSLQVQQENSNFVKENGKWYYLTGNLKPSSKEQNRNDFCNCGSGKKYKKCCGK